MIFTITKQQVVDQFGTAWKIPRAIVAAMTDEGVEVEITTDISGGFSRQTLESPAEYPECEISCVEMAGKVVGGELAEALIVLCGGEEALRERAMEKAEEYAAECAAEAKMDFMEDWR